MQKNSLTLVGTKRRTNEQRMYEWTNEKVKTIFPDILHMSGYKQLHGIKLVKQMSTNFIHSQHSVLFQIFISFQVHIIVSLNRES